MLGSTNSTASVRLWDSLVNTKIFIPRLPPNLVLRTSLIKRMNASVDCALTLMVAPAGFGKTTLLTQWIEQADRPIAWVAIDGDERSLGELIVYILSALHAAFIKRHEPVALAIQKVLGTSKVVSPDLLEAKLLEVLTNVPVPFTLVLDDYHHVSMNEVHTFMGWLIEHLPDQMNVMISSRTFPPLALPRLRAHGAMREIRTKHLRFEPEEAGEFLTRVMSLEMAPEHIALLEKRTEGWIVGLKLAALSLQEGADIKDFIGSFSGTNRYVLDYLCDEVLSRQSESTLNFLLKTSIVSRLSCDLCDAVTGGSDSQSILEEIERADLFLIPLDSERRWYRYHHLFRDILKQRLKRTYPESVRDLHRRAGEWCLAHNFIDEAIRHAIEAHDWEKVGDLVAPVGFSMLLPFPKIGTWLRSLPEEALTAQPTLALWHAGAHLLAGEMRVYDRSLRIVEKAWKNASDERNGAILLTLKSIGAIVRGEGQLAVTFCSEALSLLSSDLASDHLVERTRATLCLGAGYNVAGNPIAGEERLTEARGLALLVNQQVEGLTQFIWSNLAYAKRLRGKLTDALRVLDEADDFAKDSGLEILAQAHIYRGEILLAQNDLVGAEREFQEALASGKRSRLESRLPLLWLQMAQVHRSRGNREAAMQMLQEVSVWSEHNKVPVYAGQAEALKARFWLADGRIERTAQWIQAASLHENDDMTYAWRDHYLVLACLLLDQGRLYRDESFYRRGIGLLSRLRIDAQRDGRVPDVVQTLVMEATAAERYGKNELATTRLEEALILAMPEGAVRVFLNAGDPMQHLLIRASSLRVLPQYVKMLLDLFRTPTNNTDTALKYDVPNVELSEREMEVLQSIVDGLSNQEIAGRLFISLNTVKTHIKNLYTKLNATSRTQAIGNARTLNLI